MEEERNKQDEQEKYRNMHFRMYENEFPKKDELVLVSWKLIK